MTGADSATAFNHPLPVRHRLVLPLFIACSMLAATSGVLSGVDEWYFRIHRPSWTPPGWLFGPVWTTLHVMIGVSAWRVWRVGGFRRDRTGLGLLLVQWVLNFAWTGLFFGLRRPDIALACAAAAPCTQGASTMHRLS